MTGRIAWTAASLMAGVLTAALILTLQTDERAPERGRIEQFGRLNNGNDAMPDRASPPVPEASRAAAPTAAVPSGPAAHLLADPEPARRHLLRLVIGDAGFACEEVRSANALDESGAMWRVNCGQSQLYWVGLDAFGRWSVEPGSYAEPLNGPGGERSITIQQGDDVFQR